MAAGRPPMALALAQSIRPPCGVSFSNSTREAILRCDGSPASLQLADSRFGTRAEGATQSVGEDPLQRIRGTGHSSLFAATSWSPDSYGIGSFANGPNCMQRVCGGGHATNFSIFGSPD